MWGYPHTPHPHTYTHIHAAEMTNAEINHFTNLLIQDFVAAFDLYTSNYANTSQQETFINAFDIYFELNYVSLARDVDTLQKLAAIFSGHPTYQGTYNKICYYLGKL